jgi:hypothetical protein
LLRRNYLRVEKTGKFELLKYREKASNRPDPDDGSRPLFILVPETARGPNRPK